MKKIVSLLLLCFSAHLQAQNKNTITKISELTDSISKIVQQEHIVGLSLAITSKDSALFSGGFGYADLKAGKQVNGSTLFRMGSITKSFVAIGIMQLVEEGKLQLNDELTKIAPEVPVKNRWEKTHPVRLINLLEHTTGFDDMKLNKMYTLDRKDFSTKEMMVLQSHSMVCRWQPGERESYNNVNYVILGYIIKKTTGLEFGEYLNNTILQPLNMVNSNFNLYSKNPHLDVKEYMVSGHKIKQVPSVTVLVGPAASLWSSSDDMIKFIRFLLKKGNPILTEASIEQMETPHSSLAARAGLKSGYAMGNEDGDHYNKYSWRGHPGLVGVCTSQYLYNRKLNSGFALSCNSTRNIETIKNLIVNFLELNKPAQQIPPDQMLDQKAIKPYLGLYQKDASRFALLGFADIFMLAKTEVKNGALYMNQMGKPVKLIQVAPLTFKRQGTNTPTLIFTRNEAGDPVMIVNGRYCKMVNPFVAYSKVIILFLALLLMLFSVTLPAAILNLLRLGTFNWHKFTVFILPMVSLIALTWAVVNFSRVNEESYLLYELRQISSISISLFTGTLLFGIFSVAEFILVIKMHTQWKSRVTAWFLLLAACSFLLITTVLLLNGWIGLRTWAM